MPYVKQEARPNLDRIVYYMVDSKIRIDNLSDTLFGFCKEQVKPSYNNYKNFIGELRQCAAEIERRRLPSKKKSIFKVYPEIMRVAIRNVILTMSEIGVKADGDLNYVLFKFCKYHTGGRKRFCKALRGCALEIERELLAPYEDEKIKENGDV